MIRSLSIITGTVISLTTIIAIYYGSNLINRKSYLSLNLDLANSLVGVFGNRDDSIDIDFSSSKKFPEIEHVSLNKIEKSSTSFTDTLHISVKESANEDYEKERFIHFILENGNIEKKFFHSGSLQKKINIRKYVISEIYSIAISNKDDHLENLLHDPMVNNEKWDSVEVEWNNEYTEMKFVKKGNPNTNYRNYIISNIKEKELKNRLDRYIIGYYLLAASSASKDKKEKLNLYFVGEKAVSQNAATEFLKLHDIKINK